LNKYGSIDAIYTRLGEISSDRLRTALTEARENVIRNRELVRLWGEAAPECDLMTLQIKMADMTKLAGLYQKWGFKTLLKELEQRQQTTELLLC